MRTAGHFYLTNRSLFCRLSRALLVASCFPFAFHAFAGSPSPQELEFFENKVRPLFAENCYGCHSEQAKKLKGGLRLDSQESVLKGGKSGAVLVPGEPEASLLLKAVRYTDPKLKMPPKDKKLSAEQIACLESWVKMGAPMPPTAATAKSSQNIAEARAHHWAFQPVRKPAVPEVKNSRWVRTPVDAFILAQLEKNKIKPAAASDKRTLIRRVTFDLTGLPPSYEDVEAFINDKSPDAYGEVVERLLASPHYGERWGRYWLDVARYADTKGYLAGGEERRFAFSYTYRDYVIRAFNEDKPYDKFLLEQIAADRLLAEREKGPAGAQKNEAELAEARRGLAAMGFLTLGRRFLNNREDIIDDRIDVIARGTMGLTIGCARCHDHKFDPIPTKDYYALHGVFASSEEPAEKPLLGTLKDSPEYQDYLKQKEKIEKEITDFKAREAAQLRDELRRQVGDYLLGARDAAHIEEAKFETFAGERKLNPVILRRWVKELQERRDKPDAVFGPWFYIAQAGETNSVHKPAGTNTVVAKALTGSNSVAAAAQAYTKLFAEVDARWKATLAAADKDKKPHPSGLPEVEDEALRQVLYAENAAVNVPKEQAEEILARKISEGIAPIRNRIEALGWTHPGAPQRAMALVDGAHPSNSRVSVRGNPGNPGDEVPRGFPEVLNGCWSLPFTNGSGRLELARAITSPENPLTARVYVNRVWLHHFGQSLVSTPGDFGVRTPEPVQHALLDYLAASLMENGWSTKKLHRLIVNSAAYQQSDDASPEALKGDPDNGLFSRMNRMPLDFEAMRDTLLAVSGKLEPKLGGLPVDIISEPFSSRRTVYGLIDRQNLPGVFRTFDFANPDVSNQGRFHTTVPQQALFLMNSPFVIDQARALSQRTELAAATNTTQKVEALYHLVFQRSPDAKDLEIAKSFLERDTASESKLTPFQRYTQALLLSNELMFVD